MSQIHSTGKCIIALQVEFYMVTTLGYHLVVCEVTFKLLAKFNGSSLTWAVFREVIIFITVKHIIVLWVDCDMGTSVLCSNKNWEYAVAMCALGIHFCFFNS